MQRTLCTIVLLFRTFDCAPLSEPPIIELSDGERGHFSFDYCPVTIYDESTLNATVLVNYTAHCFCIYNPAYSKSVNCSVPGPTFKFRAGTTVHMTWYNRVLGSSVSDESSLNQYRDLSLFNVHSHGFHIDFEQDNVRISIPPQTSYTYTYTIPEDHYPGYHILHSHQHGATSFHKTAGLFSAAIIEYPDTLGERIYDPNLWNMRQTVMIMHMMYGVDRSVCDCTDEAAWSAMITQIGNRGQSYSYCYEYCSFPELQRLASDYVYDMESNIGDEFKLWLINGQRQPTVHDLVVNRWRRIRLLNVMSQYYLQLSLPLQGCSWFLLALDGLYLYESQPRDLSVAPYNGQFILPPAGRSDFAVMCSDEGVFDVTSSQSNVDSELNQLPRMDAGIVLFSLQVNSVNSEFADLEGNDISSLPTAFPLKPRYLDDLSTVNNGDIDACQCNSFDASSFDDNPCTVEMRQNGQGGASHVINALLFDPDVPMQVLQFNQIYEFTLDLGSHVYHQHIYPFQLQEDIGSGFLGHAFDYLDTIGAQNPFLIRTALYDFAGVMMIHCHNLPHEDKGMMTWYFVANELNLTSCSDSQPDRITPQPSFQPTIYFTTTQPTESPSPNPTIEPTPFPTNEPTLEPTFHPSVEPTQEPTHPTNNPTTTPSVEPTQQPTEEPTLEPTLQPTIQPTQVPTMVPTVMPTPSPTQAGDSADEEEEDGIVTTVFVTTQIPKPTQVPTVASRPNTTNSGDIITDAGKYESVFGIDAENAIIIDLVIGGIILAVVIACCVIYFCCKYGKRYNEIEESATVDSNPVDAIQQKSDLVPVQV
eukprot:954554_1